MENGAEGLVAKATSTHYLPGGRIRSGWWKLKPDYVLGLSTDLDCLVVGAYLGPSTSPERIFSQFLCAVINDESSSENDGPGEPKRPRRASDELPSFLTFCQVSSFQQYTKLW